MKATLTIDLGNEAMQTPGDVANALGELAMRLAAYAEFEDGWHFVAHDLNGNTVGHFRIEEEVDR